MQCRVFPDTGLRVSDSQNAVWDSLIETWGVPWDPQNEIGRVLTRILKIGVKMTPSRKGWSFTIHLHWDFSKSWSQIQKVGVKYSKFGVNETSE